MAGSAKDVPPIVVVRPQSGYANRLQSIASAWILAEKLQSRLLVDWIPDPRVAPVGMDSVLDPRVCENFQHSVEETLSEFGLSGHPLPRYLHFDRDAGLVTLAGMERGEQHFMPELKALLESHRVRALIISAGGKFTLDGGTVLTPGQAAMFRRERRETYGRLALHPGVETGAMRAIGERQPFHGLHLRYSDRALESPWPRSIKRALIDLRHRSESDALFIASDNAIAKRRWLEEAIDFGWKPWTVESGNLPRDDPRSSLEALIDWRVLTLAHSLVYFQASSFAEEAAVAGGSFDRSTALTATASRRAWMKIREYGSAFRSYPQRHGWR